MIDSYRSADVAAVLDLYGGLVGASALSPVDHLTAQADRLADGHRRRAGGAKVVLANHHPACIGLPAERIWSLDLAPADFRLAVARDHGFTEWPAVGAAADPSPEFEAAADAVVDGDLDALAALSAHLATARSHWGHRATLLHYVAANSVEIDRQRVSPRAAEATRMLLALGADPAATASVYGGRLTAVELLRTSAHPRAAGVAEAVERVLSAR
ncbi:MAG TPA: hypothetical protein VHV74_19195 [Pseudonocardiaceae bacterium]|jgi:hypothetical protein|nr:hypothetical protein [Pseudonocardiaceae bacterium]